MKVPAHVTYASDHARADGVPQMIELSFLSPRLGMSVFILPSRPYILSHTARTSHRAANMSTRIPLIFVSRQPTTRKARCYTPVLTGVMVPGHHDFG